jgi:hypothetical protein
MVDGAVVGEELRGIVPVLVVEADGELEEVAEGPLRRLESWPGGRSRRRA